MKIMPKAEVNEHLGWSLDFCDTLVMRMFFELRAPSQGSSRRPRPASCRPYYPGLEV